MNLEFRQVKTDEDLQQCFYIRKEVFVIEQGVPQDLEYDEYDVTPDAAHHALVLVDGKPAGAARWIPYKENTAKLQRVAVLKEYRGLKVGNSLILGMENEAQGLGYEESLLDAQCHAEVFYNKLGYSTISDEPFDDAGIPHVRMTKKLN
ncbi:GNAT family N-acetyltransferase [Paenibacillus sp. N1-5-1-14]|uniref:GNAT family N-acetyltransferase n=1 Tax=Paenibacillus radicibacter TaxID=2972488 RepID=UPI002158A282|nr:GNAT family N-acetyltransferase [Paenibacillus radicibacter]MCR8641868.1 GNAT family N-acetyltransferase [Paenibacillus radicibacter]